MLTRVADRQARRAGGDPLVQVPGRAGPERARSTSPRPAGRLRPRAVRRHPAGLRRADRRRRPAGEAVLGGQRHRGRPDAGAGLPDLVQDVPTDEAGGAIPARRSRPHLRAPGLRARASTRPGSTRPGSTRRGSTRPDLRAGSFDPFRDANAGFQQAFSAAQNQTLLAVVRRHRPRGRDGLGAHRQHVRASSTSGSRATTTGCSPPTSPSACARTSSGRRRRAASCRRPRTVRLDGRRDAPGSSARSTAVIVTDSSKLSLDEDGRDALRSRTSLDARRRHGRASCSTSRSRPASQALRSRRRAGPLPLRGQPGRRARSTTSSTDYRNDSTPLRRGRRR